ncbi:hypothetical protein SAMN05421780_101534 [Flexibacter flexilis DSM 6793]|uniref:Uncharacterized protein n=1 Tax=Flexibacter flexilis DSM 6793 TaxID=927664 RepID=A0A1I1DY13_9BACT|nr:hypothetical protein [Flexibacter flexilis]SFB79949.1 hypothetical protein SAMN05421780_101534 [Flexibacter flexilis DSM 6793]
MLNSRYLWRRIGKNTQTLDELIASQLPVVWVVPDDIVASDGSRIATYTDRVGNVWAQPSYSNRPKLITSHWYEHHCIGLGTAIGTGTNYLTAATWATIIGDFTAMFVVQQNGYGTQPVSYVAGMEQGGFFSDATIINATVGNSDSNAGVELVSATAAFIGTNKCVITMTNNAIRINGVEAMRINTDVMIKAFINYIGNMPANLTLKFNGYIAYMVLMHGGMNEYKALIESELITKYL